LNFGPCTVEGGFGLAGEGTSAHIENMQQCSAWACRA
jgi:hypothetical protein